MWKYNEAFLVVSSNKCIRLSAVIDFRTCIKCNLSGLYRDQNKFQFQKDQIIRALHTTTVGLQHYNVTMLRLHSCNKIHINSFRTSSIHLPLHPSHPPAGKRNAMKTFKLSLTLVLLFLHFSTPFAVPVTKEPVQVHKVARNVRSDAHISVKRQTEQVHKATRQTMCTDYGGHGIPRCSDYGPVYQPRTRSPPRYRYRYRRHRRRY